MTANLGMSFVYTALFATVLTTYLQSRFQKETTPTRAAIIYSAEPVISAVLAFFILHELIGYLGILGGFLILGGVLVSELWDTPFG